MGCNCKERKKVNKLIKTIDDINKSSSKNHIKNNKPIIILSINILKLLVYILFAVLLIPMTIFLLITKKPIKINSILYKNGKQQINQAKI